MGEKLSEVVVKGTMPNYTEAKTARKRLEEIKKDSYIVIDTIFNPSIDYSKDVKGIRKFSDGEEYFIGSKCIGSSIKGGPITQLHYALYIEKDQMLIKYYRR